MAKRICLFAGPGAGKSTLAHYLMFRLKSAGCMAEFVPEWVKPFAYGSDGQCPPQPIITGHQYEEELKWLKHDLVVVTESPILLGCVYGDATAAVLWNSVERQLEREHDTLRLYVDRGDKPYRHVGRWESVSEAKARDERVKRMLDDGYSYETVQYGNWDAAWAAVERRFSC